MNKCKNIDADGYNSELGHGKKKKKITSELMVSKFNFTYTASALSRFYFATHQ